MQLFLDTSNWKMVFVLANAEGVVGTLVRDDIKRVSDVFVAELGTFLVHHGVMIHDIDAIYTTTGPGSYMGIRTVLTFVKTLQTIAPRYRIFTCNSLQFQALTHSQVVSILDARGGKYYVGVYANGQALCDEAVVDETGLADLLNTPAYAGFATQRDYHGLDYGALWWTNRARFQLAPTPEAVQPVYIKGFL